MISWARAAKRGELVVTRASSRSFLELQVRLAGEVATILGRTGVSGGDRDEAGAIALRETGGDEVEAALLLQQAWSGARSLLESSRTWRQVERVAAALLQVRTVDGDDVRKLCSCARRSLGREDEM